MCLVVAVSTYRLQAPSPVLVHLPPPFSTPITLGCFYRFFHAIYDAGYNIVLVRVTSSEIILGFHYCASATVRPVRPATVRLWTFRTFLGMQMLPDIQVFDRLFDRLHDVVRS